MVSCSEARNCLFTGPRSPCGMFLLLMEDHDGSYLICETLALTPFKPQKVPQPAVKRWEIQTERLIFHSFIHSFIQ